MRRQSWEKQFSYYIIFKIPFITYAILGLLLLITREIWQPDYDANFVATFLILGKPIWGFPYWLVHQIQPVMFFGKYKIIFEISIVLVGCLLLDVLWRWLQCTARIHR
jgi:hypothetical protein